MKSDTSLKKYTSHFIWKGLKGLLKVLLWEGVGDWTKTATYWPPLLWPSVLCLSRSPGLLNWRPKGPASLGHVLIPASSHQLVSKLTDFLSSPSYIIVQSPTLEWHVWSSSSGNNCHAVHKSLSSSASVYDCSMGFYLVPYCQPSPPTRFLSITGYWDVSLPSGASLWNGMFGQVEGQYTTTNVKWNCFCYIAMLKNI